MIMKIGTHDFAAKGKTYVMGILNVTPDSFSDGGHFQTKDAILRHSEEMIRDGADVIDVGGLSTRPGHQEIPQDEESGRVTEAIRLLKDRFDIPISLDTYRAAVAAEGIQAGADMINDVWGLRFPQEKTADRMADIIARTGVPCFLMHNRELNDSKVTAAAKAVNEGKTAEEIEAGAAEAPYAEQYDGRPFSGVRKEQEFLSGMKEEMTATLSIAERAGIRRDRIILDPGVGFGKTYEENLWILRNLGYFKDLGLPMLLGASRKSVIGRALDLPVGEREEGTIVTTVLAVTHGYMFVRVHDVLKNARAVRMTEEVMNS
jgi:dihydropteroate synthase